MTTPRPTAKQPAKQAAMKQPAVKASKQAAMKAVARKPATKASKQPAMKASKQPAVKASKQPAMKASKQPATKASKQRAMKASKQPPTKAVAKQPAMKAAMKPVARSATKKAVAKQPAMRAAKQTATRPPTTRPPATRPTTAESPASAVLSQAAARSSGGKPRTSLPERLRNPVELAEPAERGVAAGILDAARTATRASSLARVEAASNAAAVRAGRRGAQVAGQVAAETGEASEAARPPERTSSPDDGPLEQLEHAHRALDERLTHLQETAGAIVRQRATSSQLAAIIGVVEFLEGAGARHEEDEEASLFPRLRGDAGLNRLIDDLAAEHVLHRHLLKTLRAMVDAWAPTGPDATEGIALTNLVGELVRAYRAHSEREDRELLPAARERLGRTDRDEIQAEMIQRRTGGKYDRRRNAGGGARRRYPAGSTGPRIRDF